MPKPSRFCCINMLSEKKLVLTLWEREGRGLRLIQAGRLQYEVANQALPVLSQTEQMLKACSEDKQGILVIGVKCHPCVKWLIGIIGKFMQQMSDVGIDIVHKFLFSGLESLLNHQIDIFVIPDYMKKEKI